MTHGLDPTVGDDGHAKAASIFGHLVDGRALWATDGHHFLRDANRSATHADTKAVYPGIDQVLGLSSSND